MTWHSPSHLRVPPGNAVDITSTVIELAGRSLGEAVHAMSGHRAVAITETGLVYADASIAARLGATVGVSRNAASMGGIITYQTLGLIEEPSWTWTPEADIFLSYAGLLTQVDPRFYFSQRIGYAVTPTSMYVELSEPVIIVDPSFPVED